MHRQRRRERLTIFDGGNVVEDSRAVGPTSPPRGLDKAAQAARRQFLGTALRKGAALLVME